MSSKKLLSAYKTLVFGNTIISDFEKRTFLLVTHISLIIAFVGIFIDIFAGFSTELTITTAVAFFLLLFMHIGVRNTGHYNFFTVLFVFLSVAAMSTLWFLNGGYNGNTSLLIYVYFIVAISILPQKLRFKTYLLYSAMVITLILIQNNYPELITRYKNEQQRVLDLSIGFLIYLAFAYNTQNQIMKNFTFEQEKVRIKNKQLKELIGKLNEAKTKLEDAFHWTNELNNSKDRFIAVLSHDLRSPFQGILGMAKMLNDEYDVLPDEEKKYYIQRLTSSLDKHYAFMEELLLWGRMQRNSVSLYIDEVNVKDLIVNSVSVFAAMAADKKIKIETSCEDNLNEKMDRELISVVIRNLVSNAIKFSPVNSTVKIEASHKPIGLQISVVDNGVGILEEDLEKLFKIEETFSTKGTAGETGSGLGLILCSEILRKHGGSIIVHSREDKGSVFTMQLPGR